VGDVIWAKEHHLSKATEGFAANVAPRYDGPYQVVDFVSPVICKRKSGPFTLASSSNNKTSRRQTHQMANKRYEATGLCVRPKRESSTRHAERTIIWIGNKDMDKDFTLI